MRHGAGENLGGRERQEGRVAYISGAAVEMVSLDELKVHLRIRYDNEDDYLTSLIESALDEIDMPRKAGTPPGWLGRALGPRTLRLTLEAIPPPVIRLPGAPVTAVTLVEFRKEDDTFETIPDTEYNTDFLREPALLWTNENWPFFPLSWPNAIRGGPDTFRVTYVAGYVDAAAAPAVIKQWILVRAGDLYRDREGTILGTISGRLKHIERMLDAHKVR